MKLAILLVVVSLFLSTHAYERTWSKGDTLLYDLQTLNDELYIIMFFDSTNTDATYSKVVANEETTKGLIPYLSSISENQPDAFPNKVYFSKIDAVDPYNQNLMFKVGVKAKTLDEGPVVVALRKGKGYRYFRISLNFIINYLIDFKNNSVLSNFYFVFFIIFANTLTLNLYFVIFWKEVN